MQLSFRDPDGFVLRCGERIFRCVLPHAVDDLRSFLSSTLASTWIANRTISPTTFLGDGASRFDALSELREKVPEDAVVLEQQPIQFANYPYEWAPEMLQCAAELTLRLARAATGAGFGLKDATPYNIMFDGSKPVFIDVLSFERRNPLDTLWRPYAQLVRTFIYPLFASRYFGLRLDETLLAHRDGLDPERILRLCSTWRLLLPPFLGSVTIPTLLSRANAGRLPNQFRPRYAKDFQEAGFLLHRLFRRAERLLLKAANPARKNAALQYMSSGHNYSAPELAEKERLVVNWITNWQPDSVLDVGCNNGHFSLLAARHAQRVVAIDRDPQAVGMLWRTANESGLNILPLVIDIARPPGACGWANREFASFLDRANGRFDCVLMLALIHHLLVNERVPLDSIFELVAGLTAKLAIVEYVDPADAHFQRIARGRDALHRNLTKHSFEACARRRFGIVASCDITPTRCVYVLQKPAG